MAYPPVTDFWPHTPLAMDNLPAIQNPDFIICDRYYAGPTIDLDPWECRQSAGRLPVGSIETEYQRAFPYYLETQIVTGHCKVEVTKVSRTYFHNNPPFMKPDVFRELSAQIIRQCVIPRGHGGFATLGMQNLIDWATNSATTLNDVLRGPIPPGVLFFTVSVMGSSLMDPNGLQPDPGSRDPAIAYDLAHALFQASQAQPDGSVLKDRYEMEATNLEDRGNEMERGGTVHWYGYNASPLSFQDHMVYECDSKLGVPVSADCSQLAYSELGPPSDTVTIGPNAVKFLSSKTCNVAIMASINLVVTWHQIKVALDTLINTCVMHPLLPARGGRAYAGTQSAKQKFHSLGIGRKRDTVTGLNALSPHVNLTLFQQTEPVPVSLADELKTCTWEQVEKGGNIRTCTQGPPSG